jgi:hypothetical protein
VVLLLPADPVATGERLEQIGALRAGALRSAATFASLPYKSAAANRDSPGTGVSCGSRCPDQGVWVTVFRNTVSAADLGTFFRALFGGKLISHSALEEMTTIAPGSQADIRRPGTVWVSRSGTRPRTRAWS